MTLANQQCSACNIKESRPLTQEAIEPLLKEVPLWKNQDNRSIERTFKFKNFRQAFEYVKCISELAEKENHHPDITFGWGYCRVVFFTHAIEGLHENDFIMAAKLDAMLQEHFA
jgi:4a-hydroxytetrahydrobiopterin dehydratase